ncbi:tripartite tricarboxylate transporter permease [Thermodesulfobacteriota bacterium]
MIEAFIEAITWLFRPSMLIILVAATAVGLFVGVLPALGGMVGCALLLVILPYMSPEIGLTILLAFHSVTFTGGSITAILLNIPGTNVNAATLIDGFPMSQRGEGERAIGASVTSSSLGGLVPVFLAFAMIPLIMPIVMLFKTPEMLGLIILGLSCLAFLTGDSVIKGCISGCLGLLLAMIGFHGATGILRFTFGIDFLYDGFDLVALALGMFGVAELLDISIKGHATVAPKYQKSGGLSNVMLGVKDVFNHKSLWLRSMLIGYVAGIIPGVGAETATFIAYAQAKQTSRHPELFGTGVVEGVIAPEAANNAKEAGALLTTLAFGIPGSAIMAILLGAFMMVNVIPGPRMLIDYLPLCFTMLLGIAFANVIGGVISLFAAPYLCRAASIHIDFLLPVVLILAYTGVYVLRESMFSIASVIFFALLGILMKRYGYSRPALLLGFVLGLLFEKYFWLSLKFWGPLFFMKPSFLIEMAIVLALFAYPYLRKVFSRSRKT